MSINNSGFYKMLGAASAAAFISVAAYKTVPHVQHLEGRSLSTYYDIAGVMTYCDGETSNARADKKYTNAECDQITQKHVAEFAKIVASSLEKPVSEQMFMSLTIFSYNIGATAFKNSSTLRLINAGKIAEGCQSMMRFVCYSVPSGKGDTLPVTTMGETFTCVTKQKNKKFSKGLANRRYYERKLCLQ